MDKGLKYVGGNTIKGMALGSQVGRKLYLGATLVWDKGYGVVCHLTNITTNAPSNVSTNGSLIATLTPTTDYRIQNGSIVITMGETDITATAYDSTNNTITIASVTGDVSITAVAMPYDAEVEWLKSDGSGGRAYIDTGIKASNTVTFDIKLTLGNKVNSQVFGGRNAYNNKALHVYFDNTNNRISWSFGSGTTNLAGGWSAGDYTLKNTTTPSKIVINGTTVSLPSSTFTSDYNIYLFALNNGGKMAQPSSNSQITLLSAKFYSSGTLVRDYIPVRKDGVGYLYDKVSNTLFGNANSSGAFTYGNDKT